MLVAVNMAISSKRCFSSDQINLLGICVAAFLAISGQPARAGTQNSDSKPLAVFDSTSAKPFEGRVTTTREHAEKGRYSLKLNSGYAVWNGSQNWSGYDYVRADVYNASPSPIQLYVEIHDSQTTGYWTRVNYSTVVPPGPSVLTVPTDLYVGEKSRPGRSLVPGSITRLVFSIGDSTGPLYFDNLRLEKDSGNRVTVPGLKAFSFGPEAGRAMSGFTPVNPKTIYSPNQGFGLSPQSSVKSYDVLQPDPLYQRGMIIWAGTFTVDLPNGKYHAFINLDFPSGFWGEVQTYRHRSLSANGVEVLHESLDLSGFLKYYFQFAEEEDQPQDNTFEKYMGGHFHEKEFDFAVTDGHLALQFNGDGQANSVSALVVYPLSESAAGRKYLANLRERRRAAFDNSFKRVLPSGDRDSKGVIPPFVPTAEEVSQGWTVFVRDWMEEIPYDATPRREETATSISISASAGQLEPIVFSLAGLRDLGEVTVTASGLIGSKQTIPATAIRTGVISHRLTRVTAEGSVYTISPKLILPRNSASIQKGRTATFWLTLQVPKIVATGDYHGKLTLHFPGGRTTSLSVEARLFSTPLDELDVPAGPWGSTINIPWFAEEVGETNRALFRKSLSLMRAYGCTTFSGIPTIRILRWKDRVPEIDFTEADREMSDARSAGFKSILVNYNGGIQGFDNYHVDSAAMSAAGYTNYSQFLRVILKSVANHATTANWLPFAFNLCDEPISNEDVQGAATNAMAWRDASPSSLLTTGATSIAAPKAGEPRIPLVRALRIANLNEHDEASINLIHEAGNDWAFYNGGSRWTFGTYMYKAVKEYGMKFRLSWHWNASAGDPYYPLDCREDDYAWAVTNAKGELIPTIFFDRDIRAGIDDYRAMETLARLIKSHPNTPSAKGAQLLLQEKLSAFKLGDRLHEAKWPLAEFRVYRLKLLKAIERLSTGD